MSRLNVMRLLFGDPCPNCGRREHHMPSGAWCIPCADAFKAGFQKAQDLAKEQQARAERFADIRARAGGVR